MKNSLKSLLILAGLLAVTSSGFAQTILANTTLSAVMPATTSSATTTGNQQLAIVASATGISAPTPNVGNVYGLATSEAQSYLYVDRELMQVKAVSGTSVTVIRGVLGTSGSSHASSALVFVVPSTYLFGTGFGAVAAGPAVPQGSCTRASELFLPRIAFGSGVISDCVGGQWVNGDAMQTQRNSGTVLLSPNPGGTIYTSLNSTGTAPSATVMNCTEIQLPYSKLVTGLGILNGTAIGTDNHLVALYDATGNLVANSAVAGVLAATASEYQQISFTSKYYLVGPAQYFGCMQSNGTTATVRMLVTQVQDTFLTKGVTAQTFGTVPATITVPTTFTTAVGPYLSIF